MKIEWEYDLVEKPFCEQLKTMGWEWIEGDPDLPESTERDKFARGAAQRATRGGAAKAQFARRETVAGRCAHRARHSKPRTCWRPPADGDQPVRDGIIAQGNGGRWLTELGSGTTAAGASYIDFENWANNDFLVINQFKVELTSGRGHIIADAVLFVNGIPLVVAEFKSPGIQNPLQEAINQLLRYSNQRRELFPTLYTENEGVERLFHTNQLLIASNFFEARAATVGAPPEAYLEWADTSPVPMSTVAEELGLISASPDQTEAEEEVTALGPEQSERSGIPLFFRTPEQRPAGHASD